jgi:flagellar protein FliT
MANAATQSSTMNTSLLTYYEAIERASADMLSAARAGDWDTVISQLKQAARGESLQPVDAQARTRIMQRILLRDAEIRHLAEPWLEQIDGMLAGKPRTLH